MKMKKMLPLAVVAAALLVGLGAGRVYSAHKLAKSNDLVVTRGDYDLYLVRPDQVAFYSLQACGGCEKTRRLLRELGVDYVERPADTSMVHRQELHRLDAKRVPVIVTAGYKLEGYDRDRTIALLEEQGYLRSGSR
ncbi:glutaredoxin family protein [Pseudoxanthomonas sp. PXM03]|nr:glutaredoxin family protein [Pseudoxanthomonas sp. PXM03]